MLVDELGIEPEGGREGSVPRSSVHEPSLEAAGATDVPGVILVWRYGAAPLGDALALAEHLVDDRELIVADLVPRG